MITSTYDPCLLVATNKTNAAVVGMQIDNTLILGTKSFSNLEEQELKKADFPAKLEQRLNQDKPIIFNADQPYPETTRKHAQCSNFLERSGYEDQADRRKSEDC